MGDSIDKKRRLTGWRFFMQITIAECIFLLYNKLRI